MKRVFLWLKDRWYLPVLIGISLVFWLASRGKRSPPVDVITRELAAIREGDRVRREVADIGKTRALENLSDDYAHELSVLDERLRKKAERLKNDPVSLSKFLVRIGSS